ncbi:Cyclin-dependent kinase catalytic subunit [Perkinsus olseni]|uniref:Cyclin-dependent kinase 2 homolog n=1 Tax=Perkinsus olseni TaxID=32597 RepID=A0A7J6PBW2_PEROL|nr:Cyclin-dependent kinase catalytic subunit [Perkinsus olseni]
MIISHNNNKKGFTTRANNSSSNGGNTTNTAAPPASAVHEYHHHPPNNTSFFPTLDKDAGAFEFEQRLDQEDEGVPSTAIREVSLLKELRHPNIVKLLDVFCSQKKLYLIFEFVDLDLKKHMKQVGGLTKDKVQSFAYQLLLGTNYCHEYRVIHRDLKPQNLLIDADGTLKLADFGLARAFSLPIPKYTHEVVTVWYRAPEILLGSSKYSIPIDNWSVGCIIAEMATNTPLFPGDSEIDTIFRIFRKLGTPNESVWAGVRSLPDFKDTFPQWRPRGWENIPGLMDKLGPAGCDLLSMFLAYNPADRLSCKRGLEHPYFAALDKTQFHDSIITAAGDKSYDMSNSDGNGSIKTVTSS